MYIFHFLDFAALWCECMCKHIQSVRSGKMMTFSAKCPCHEEQELS